MKLYIDGCSYSSYIWPTWADLLVKHYPKNNAVNLANSGAGNEKIFFNLAHYSKHFIPGTTKVILQWSSYPRIDYWKIPLKWNGDGNRYYTGDFIERNKDWWSDDYLQFKVYYYVELAAKLLSSMNVEFYFMTMDNWHTHKSKVSNKLGMDWDKIIDHPNMIMHDMDTYIKDDLKYVYQSPWQSEACPDGHPSIPSHIKIANYINDNCLGLSLDESLIHKYLELDKLINACSTKEQIEKLVQAHLYLK